MPVLCSAVLTHGHAGQNFARSHAQALVSVKKYIEIYHIPYIIHKVYNMVYIFLQKQVPVIPC